MPQERLQVSSGMQVDPLRPVAAPVDTFNPNADKAASSKLSGLAQGLAAIYPGMQRYAGQVVEADNEKKHQEGLDLATQLSANGQSYADAVSKGLIPQHANPFFMAGLYEQMGRVMGDKEHADLITARAGDDALQNTLDQSDYEKFDAQHHSQWSKDNVDPKIQNKFFQKGYDSRLNTYAESDSQSIAREIAGRIDSQANDAQHDEMMANIQDNIRNGASPEQIAKDLNSSQDDLIAHHGRDKGSVLRTTVAAIVDAAKSDPTNGMRILEAIKSVTGKFGPLSNTTYGAEAYQKTRDYIGSEQMKMNREEEQKAREEKRTKVTDIYSQMTAALSADPHTDVTKFQQALQKVDPAAAAKLPEMVRKYNSSTVTTNAKIQTSLIAGIYDGSGDTTVETILQHAGNGDLTWQDAQEDILKLKKRAGRSKSITSDPDFIRASAELRHGFTTEQSVFNPTIADNARNADTDFQRAYEDWMDTEEGQKATAQQKTAFFNDQETKLIAHYRREYQTKPEPRMMPAKTVGTTTPSATRVVPINDLIAFAKPLKPGGPPSLAISDTARALAKRYGAKSEADVRAFMQKQLHLQP